MLNKFKVNKELFWVSIIFSIGLAIRLSFALFTPPNLEDLEIFSNFANIINRGGNVYSETTIANYSPLWLYFLFLFKKLSLLLDVKIHYIIRIFMVIIDCLNGLLIFQFAKKINFNNRFLSYMVYAFNPAVILITSYHSNIDAFAIFPLLVAINLKNKNFKWVWVLATLSIFIKQITAFLFLTLLIYCSKSIKQFITHFLLSCILFLLSFLPYISAYENIIKHVFGHSGVSGYFGLTLFLPEKLVFFLFFLVMSVIPLLARFKWKLKIHEALLLSSLAFIIFAPGFFGQYQLAALVFGSLIPNLYYLFLSTTGLIFLISYYSFANIYNFRHLLWWGALLFLISRFKYKQIEWGEDKTSAMNQK